MTVREVVDTCMEPVASLLLFGLGIYLVLSDKVEVGVAIATSSMTYWFKNGIKKGVQQDDKSASIESNTNN